MVHYVCNNYGLITDGIGVYAKNVVNELNKRGVDVAVHTTNLSSNKRLFELFSLRMTGCLFRLIPSVKRGDKIIIEYPFSECNVIICIPLFFLFIKTRILRVHLILSLHEYLRVHFLRKLIIRWLINISDILLLTDKSIVHALKLKQKYFIREIPSNIVSHTIESVDEKNNQFLFFGLINKSKAFEEMLKGWCKFNKDKKCYLIIATSSQFRNIYENENVKCYQRLPDEKIAKLFQESKFCVLPIKPSIDKINATYKTCLSFQCIPIGYFGSKNKNFAVNLRGLSSDDFCEGFKTAVGLSQDEINKNKLLIKNIDLPSFEKTASVYIDALSL